MDDQYRPMKRRTRRRRVYVVGQVPPPIGGQAVMIQTLLNISPSDFAMVHIQMRLSSTMAEVGKFKLIKLCKVPLLVAQILLARIRLGPGILYYPPASPNRLPILRDIVILLSTRWAFRGSVFHFHASGLGAYLDDLTRYERWLARRAYAKPSAAIQPSRNSAPDGKIFSAKEVYIVPNGIREVSCEPSVPKKSENDRFVVVFVGLLMPEKGVFELLEAISALKQRGIIVEGRFVGDIPLGLEMQLHSAVARLGLRECITFYGVKSGVDKAEILATSNVFCFPSWVDNHPLVVIEAMACGLPVVAAAHAGCIDLVADGLTGILVPCRDSEALAEALIRLATDPKLRESMGRAGRRVYINELTVEKFQSNMEKVLISVLNSVESGGNSSQFAK